MTNHRLSSHRIAGGAITACALIFLSACAHKVQKAEIPTTASPSTEIAQLETDINAGYGKQYDVLASEDFDRAQKWLKKGKEALASGEKQQEILNDIAYGRAYLQRTQDLAEGRRAQLEGILEAREAAVEAGARQYPEEKDRIKQLDDGLRRIAGEREISPNRFGKLQRGYMNLETSAVQSTQLNQARAQINGAIHDGAKTHTPTLLKGAQIDLNNATNTIAANWRDPHAFKAAVERANASSQLLLDVLAATHRGPGVSESTALDIVLNERKIHRLQGEVGHLQGQLGKVEQERQAMSQELNQQQKKLSQAEMAQALDRVLSDARKEFSRDEAEVFREGDKLLIRLKSIGFASGRSDLPASSLPLLAKVKGIASDLKPRQVVIEGHTDSTGKPAENLQLSQNRAEAVAQYLETSGISGDRIQAIGQGYKQPIATNKTKEGRAQNRRVDVIIVPAGSAN